MLKILVRKMVIGDYLDMKMNFTDCKALLMLRLTRAEKKGSVW